MTQGESDRREKPKDRRPGDRASTLAEAILEISASLDVDTVVRKVVEEARSLTGARLGIIATIDESGVPGEFFFSGYTPEEQRELLAWPHGLQLFEHFRELPGPLRRGDFAGYARALGLTPLASFSVAFQGTPMRHRGMSIGYFFLGAKVGGEAFTDADEEVLVLFASQAAAAIANARAHRGEQRARRDLEALIETSPVGVVVFDAGSGRMVSCNREARRIVESLRMPGRPPEELLGVVVCRRADGREVSLAELPLAQQFARAETVRAEEVVLSVRDGRSVRTLINATPIEAEGQVPGSVVVTLQDLAPLDEVERLRTEFLGLVSHELRAPLSAIKGAGVTLMEEPVGFDPAEMREFHRIIVEQADQMRGLIADLLDTGRIDSGTLSVSPEPSAVAELVEGARSAFLTGDGRRGLVVDLAVDLPPVMADRRRIVQVTTSSRTPPGTRRSLPSSVWRPSARPGMSRSQWPTTGRASSPACCRTCSARTSAAPAARRARAWGSRSARGSSRRMVGVSAPQATARARGPRSPSRSRSRRSPAARRALHPAGGRARKRRSARASWWSTTTRACCASCATR